MKNLLIKNVDSKTLVEQVQKMVNHFKKYNFLQLDSNNALHYGFNANAVKQNIRNEWLLSNSIYCDEPCFHCSHLKALNEFKNAYKEVRQIVTDFPFSFVQVFGSKVDVKSDSKTDVLPEVKEFFSVDEGVVLKKQTICTAKNSFAYFHRLQRERKIWWKKFSSLPGRFSVSAVNTIEKDNSQYVNILAEFPWGIETIEKIRLMPFKLKADASFFKIKESSKQLPHVISNEMLLEKALVTFLCDSYEGLNEESDQEVLRLSKKLAPYKIAFAGSASTDELSQNLKDLALLLSKKIRKNGISVLNLPDVCSMNIEEQIRRNDAFGIPYTIILNEATLNDGVIGIRSRDTTLKEQSHVSLVESYVEMLMKNY